MDLLHAHHPFIAGRLALRYGRRFGQPVIYTNHTRLDLYAGVYVPRPLRGLARWLVRWYLPHFCARCDLVIAPSAGLRDVMRDLWGVRSPMVVVPNGVDPARFSHPTTLLGRSELGLPPEGILAVYTGRLGAEKNLDFLLQAFARAGAAETGVQLLLLGDGPQARSLQALARELGLSRRVSFPGAVAYERVPAYLAAADLFVSASVTEVHPMSLIEGLMAGLPVLGVVSPGIADTIEDGVNGLLSAHDLAAFSGSLRRLLTDAALRARLAEGARKTRARYGIAHTTARIVELYQQLLAERRQRGEEKR
jgi:glycosyltransferase involved in cell wall biosynthesis